MHFTLGDAAKRLGLSKPTVSKFVKDGRISAQKIQTGKTLSYKIDAAELARFEAEYEKPATGKRQGEAPTATRDKSADLIIALAELGQSKERVQELAADRDRLRSDLEKAHERLDKMQDQIAAIAAEQVRQGKVPFWQKLIGKG